MSKTVQYTEMTRWCNLIHDAIRTIDNEKDDDDDIGLSINRSIVIAGGCWRDTILEKEVKDIDVWVNGSEFLGVQWDSLDQLNPDYQHRGIIAVGDFVVHGVPYPVNVIILQSGYKMSSLLDNFDFGICRVGWSRKAGLVMTEEFIQDLHDQTLTLYRTNWGELGVQRHYERLKKKFPEYTLVNRGNLSIEA